MNKKLLYEDAKLEVILFPIEDIVTTSVPGAEENWQENTDTSDGSWV